MSCGAKSLTEYDTRMSAHLTSLSSWSAAIKSCLDERGLDSAALFARAGLNLDRLAEPAARYPLSATTRLWQLAIDASGDEALGLAVASHVRQTTFHALGYAVMASPNLLEAFSRMLRYFRVVSDAGALSFERTPQGYCYRMLPLPGQEQPSDAALDAFMAVVVRSCRALSGRDFSPLQVNFRRPEPADATPWQRCFRAPLQFGQAQTEMLLDEQTLMAPLPWGNAELARHNDEILSRLLAQQQRESLPARVQALIAQSLKEGEPAQERIASELNLSLRQLQRKLRQDNTSFREILETTRRQLAERYLQDPHYSLGEIAWLLGFGESSSFLRAFKRWHGVSPRQWRESVQRP